MSQDRSARSSWALALAIVVLAFNLRSTIVVVPPLLDRLGPDLGLSTFGASVLGTLPPAVFAVAGLTGAAVIAKLGMERAAWAAMAAAAVGQGWRAVAESPTAFILASALAIAGLGLGNVVVPPLVKKYFPNRLGLITGAYVVVLQLGTAIPAQLAVLTADWAGWRVSVGMWAIAAVVGLLPWLGIDGLARRRRAAEVLPTRGLPLRTVATSSVAWSLVVVFGVQSLTAYVLIAWLPTILTDSGLPASVGGSALATFALFQIPMSLAAPVLLARLRQPFWLFVAFAAAYLAAFIGLATTPQSAPLLWAALLGLGSGPFPVSLALLTLRSESPAGAASLSAFVQGIGYIAAATGPLLTGWLRQVTGSWHASLVLLMVLLVPALIGAWVASRPRTLEADLGGR